jgi:hypothetical protein
MPTGRIPGPLNPFTNRPAAAFLVAALLLLGSESALALRCGNRIVKKEMIESEVVALCGEPTSVRHLGFVLVPYVIKVPAGEFGSRGVRRVYGGYHEQLAVTEMLFNFGPHRLMRLIRFEGGRVASIKTVGYGYREKK